MDDRFRIPHEFLLPENYQFREFGGGKISLQNFEPPGPVGEGYMYGQEPIDFIMGPVGSAKTSCSIFRCGAMTMRMPVCNDDVVRARIAVVHANFRALYRTTLPSIFQFFPRDFPGFTFEGGQDRPFCYTLRFITPRGRKLQLILDGFGVGDHNVEEMLRGYQPSGAWHSEADLLPRKVPSFMFSRVAQNRYPPRADLRDTNAKMPKSVWGDLNAPLISHWIHEDFVDKPRKGYVLRRQPSGLSDQAENRKYASRDGYQAMADTLPPDDVRRFVHGEFGLVGDGALVYPEFDYTIHVAKAPLEPLDMPIRVSFDAGGSPAGVIRQFTPRGHLRVLDELAADPGTGVGRFAEMFLDLLQSKYRRLPIVFGFGDPSAFHGADRQAGELSFMEVLGKTLGVQILPTPTNEPHARQESVAYFLRKRLDTDGAPFFLMSPTCKLLLGGFQGGFIIALNKHDTSDRIAFVKNKFSHPHEALQYGAYGDRGHAGMINDAARAGRSGNILLFDRPVQGNTNFDVWSS